jgi:hypothetical protein
VKQPFGRSNAAFRSGAWQTMPPAGAADKVVIREGRASGTIGDAAPQGTEPDERWQIGQPCDTLSRTVHLPAIEQEGVEPRWTY